jgi:hypothetical protein
MHFDSVESIFGQFSMPHTVQTPLPPSRFFVRNTV